MQAVAVVLPGMDTPLCRANARSGIPAGKIPSGIGEQEIKGFKRGATGPGSCLFPQGLKRHTCCGQEGLSCAAVRMSISALVLGRPVKVVVGMSPPWL